MWEGSRQLVASMITVALHSTFPVMLLLSPVVATTGGWQATAGHLSSLIAV